MNDSKTLIDLIRENLSTWEEIDPKEPEEDDYEEPKKKEKTEDINE